MVFLETFRNVIKQTNLRVDLEDSNLSSGNIFLVSEDAIPSLDVQVPHERRTLCVLSRDSNEGLFTRVYNGALGAHLGKCDGVVCHHLRGSVSIRLAAGGVLLP